MKHFIQFAVLVLLFGGVASAQQALRSNWAITYSSGFAQLEPNASVQVCTYNAELLCPTANVTITSDVAGQDPLPNPTNADGNGYYTYFYTPGVYVEKVCGYTGSGCKTFVISGNAGGSAFSGDATSLQGIPILAGTPTFGQVLTYGVGNEWRGTFVNPAFVNYNSLQTGNVTTTLQSLLINSCDGVDASEYNVLPTNADNAPGFAAAFAAATNTGAGIVCLPGGTYKVNSTVDIPTKNQLRGRGRGDVGVIGSGGINSVIQASSTFPANTPVVTLGSLAGGPRFGSRISDLKVDCNGAVGGIGIQDFYGEEQSGGIHIGIDNCSAYGLQVLGSDQPSTGRVQNEWGWEDLEIFPTQYATASTIPVLMSNVQEGYGLRRVSIVGSSGYPYNYAIVASGANYHIESVHIEQASLGGLLLNSNTVGTTDGVTEKIHIDNIVMSTNAVGAAVHIAYNGAGTPTGIEIFNPQGNNNCDITDDIQGYTCLTTPVYILGGQFGGNPVTLNLGYGGQWNLYNNVFNHGQYVSYNDNVHAGLDLKNGTSFKGQPLFVDVNGVLDFGEGGLEGGGGYLFHNPGSFICINGTGDARCAGLQLEYPLSTHYTSGVLDNFYYDPVAGNYNSIGVNNTGLIGGLVGLNPGGPEQPYGGGYAIVSQNNVNGPTTFNEATMDTYIKVIFPGWGGIRMVNGTQPNCDANSRGLWFYVQDGSNVNDVPEWCGILSSAYGWHTFGTGSGGGAVSSVGLTAPSWLAVTGSPVTTAGTLAVTPATGQTSHLVIGTCGSATTFTPCALTAADIPTLNQNTTGTSSNVTGIVSLAHGGTGTATPGLVAGTNVTITGSWPNQTINATGGGGGGGSFTVNGVAVINPATINFTNSVSSNGVTVGFSNASGGNVQLTYSGYLTVPGGGTGATSFTAHGPILGEGSGPLVAAAAGTAGLPFLSGGASADGAFGALALSSSTVTGSLPLANIAAIAGNTVLGNATGSSAVPSALNGASLNTLLSATPATNTTFGVVKPDGTSITATGGVLSVVGGAVNYLTINGGSPLTPVSGGINLVIPTPAAPTASGMSLVTSGGNLNFITSAPVDTVASAGSGYTVPIGDCTATGGTIIVTGSTTESLGIAQAGLSSNFVAGCKMNVINLSTGAVTISFTTSTWNTISGTSAIVLAGRSSGTAHTAFIVSDGSNYEGWQN